VQPLIGFDPTSPAGITLAVLAAASIVVGALFVRRHETRLAAKAERAFPGPLAPPR
jgi:hypothetical protein